MGRLRSRAARSGPCQERQRKALAQQTDGGSAGPRGQAHLDIVGAHLKRAITRDYTPFLLTLQGMTLQLQGITLPPF